MPSPPGQKTTTTSSTAKTNSVQQLQSCSHSSARAASAIDFLPLLFMHIVLTTRSAQQAAFKCIVGYLELLGGARIHCPSVVPVIAVRLWDAEIQQKGLCWRCWRIVGCLARECCSAGSSAKRKILTLVWEASRPAQPDCPGRLLNLHCYL